MNEAAGDARIPSLDILRGIAVMGILAMNVAAFSMPAPAYSNPTAYGTPGTLDLGVWLFDFILIDGKMRALFSLLFGASMLLLIEKASARGEDEATAHLRRMSWLFLFGLIHFLFIWWGDILLHYALVGLIAFVFRDLPLRSLALWIGLLLLIQLGLMIEASLAFIEASEAAAAAGASAQDIANWNAVSQDLVALEGKELAEDLQTHRSTYLSILDERLDQKLSLPVRMLIFSGAETLALMLLGMAGLKSGFLTGRWPANRYRLVGILFFLFGFAGFALLGLLIMRSGFEPTTLFVAMYAGTTVFRIAMVIGYAGLILLLTRKGGALVDRIAAAGRVAFTNYLGTSILMTFIFYGYGLGLYGRLGRAELWIPVLLTWILMLVWSPAWLRIYRYGPLEWLWRSLARGRPQPMRKQG